ncbi:MAG: two pore domain potassium channel family protein [Clostridium sp.]|nr:two pore domain potassium channel family protein [Clostridium sp.]
MIKIFIVLCKILIIVNLISFRSYDNRITEDLKNTFIDINNTYKEIFTEKDLISRTIHGLIFIVSEVLVIFTVVTIAIDRVIKDTNIGNVLYAILIIIILLLVIHLGLGYLLLITSGIQKFISKVEDKFLKNNLLTSYFIISTYLAIYILNPKQFYGIEFIALIGLLVSYILNLKILIKLIVNPEKIKSNSKGKNINKNDNITQRIAIVSVLLLLMIVLNLFLATGIINQTYPGSFSNNPNRFDLFYYTIITFTTIGYGDIVPANIPAKIISMIISITSVICLTIFLSTVMSYGKDED